MKPETRSRYLLSITRSKAKMYEYDVPAQHHIDIPRDPANLFPLAIGLLGDAAAGENWHARNETQENGSGSTLLFSAQFFDNYLQTRLQEDLDPYLLLLGSAAYYLCDFPGSSVVLANRLGRTCPDLGGLGLEDLLLRLLQRRPHEHHNGIEGPYATGIDGVSRGVAQFFGIGVGQEQMHENTSGLRRIAYDVGTPRQLLLADIIGAVVQKRFENSTWHRLPQYSGLSIDLWQQTLQKQTFVRELWPAQHLLGARGVFRGRSAVVQMPTSAGKTKATEIVIRSAFLAGRTSLAAIVAPFRALCHEIRNDLVEAFRGEPVRISELSDVLQLDLDISKLLEHQQVLVVTPEKLVYTLRHAPELAQRIGLVVYDEGHQFDNGTRGITYELLLASLKMIVPRDAQKLLISAVIKNADAVGAWLNGEDAEVISGTHLSPTYRSLAFTSWLDQLGRLEFVDQSDPDSEQFFVPRIIEQQQLRLRGREREERVFPMRDDGGDVALYLGLKIVPKGSVAIFCGRKSSVSALCERVVDVYRRGLSLGQPRGHSDEAEILRLHYLHERNLGAEAPATKSAQLGVLAHHGNTPRGIRLAVEYAMKEGWAKFVICTSTLAQGVNLPIRYLIVTSVHQGQDRIKVRDFHNLIGRAGRSGMYTEGSILFADPSIYDRRHVAGDAWRWDEVRELLEPSNAEPCTSMLASIFDPLHSDDRRYHIDMAPLDFAGAYVNGDVDALVKEVASQHEAQNFTTAGLEEQVASKMNVISAVESYLMAHWDESQPELRDRDVAQLASETLAFFLADGGRRAQIIELFTMLAQNIARRVPDPVRRRAFGKTLYGVETSLAIETWTGEHIYDLIACSSFDELLLAVWPLISKNVQNNTFNKCSPPDVLSEVALGWIHGKTFYDLLARLADSKARIGTGQRRRYVTVEHVVDICENALSFDGALLLGAVAEILTIMQPAGSGNLVSNLHKLQKQVKHGLSSTSAIMIHEMGFADRVVAQEMALIINSDVANREMMTEEIRRNETRVRAALEKYPRYFAHILDEVL